MDVEITVHYYGGHCVFTISQCTKLTENKLHEMEGHPLTNIKAWHVTELQMKQ
jgi:hypothetical protein